MEKGNGDTLYREELAPKRYGILYCFAVFYQEYLAEITS